MPGVRFREAQLMPTLRRGTVVVAPHYAYVQWCSSNMWTPQTRVTAQLRLQGRLRRPIWHKTPAGRAVFLPIAQRV